MLLRAKVPWLRISCAGDRFDDYSSRRFSNDGPKLNVGNERGFAAKDLGTD